MSGTRKPLERWERGLIAATVLFVGVVLGACLYWQWLNADPVVAIPPPVEISPNARDLYIQAGDAIQSFEVVRE